MALKFKYIPFTNIHKISCSVNYNYWSETSRHSTWWLTNQNSLKVPKVVKPTNKKTTFKYLGMRQ